MLGPHSIPGLGGDEARAIFVGIPHPSFEKPIIIEEFIHPGHALEVLVETTPGPELARKREFDYPA
jgi:hypothetical protein